MTTELTTAIFPEISAPAAGALAKVTLLTDKVAAKATAQGLARGEALATRCEQHLAGARKRVEDAISHADDASE